ncbi:MAG TPA: dehydrogenase [Clostridiales bacterium]|nr:dehydrogenase [Clostridiales bacterium]
MKDRIGWGFIGAGGIAGRFMSGMQQVPEAALVAVGSKTPGKGEAFTAKYGGQAVDSYEEVVAHPDVDVVYIATPHTFHLEHTLLALSAGKAVLCEKPMAPSAAQVRAMMETASAKGLYLMEAMWTRFFPVMQRVREWLAAGEIGQIQYVTADFGFGGGGKENPASRLFSPDLAGGSLLDVGVYTLAFAFMAFGRRPNRIVSLSDPASTGVDGRMGCLLGYEGGGIASLFSAVTTTTPQEARIIGANGIITIPGFWHPRSVSLARKGQPAEEFRSDHPAEGFQFEIEAVHEDLRAGRLENAVMPLQESLAIAETMDALRAQWGLRYPFEK